MMPVSLAVKDQVIVGPVVGPFLLFFLKRLVVLAVEEPTVQDRLWHQVRLACLRGGQMEQGQGNLIPGASPLPALSWE